MNIFKSAGSFCPVWRSSIPLGSLTTSLLNSGSFQHFSISAVSRSRRDGVGVSITLLLLSVQCNFLGVLCEYRLPHSSGKRHIARFPVGGSGRVGMPLFAVPGCATPSKL